MLASATGQNQPSSSKYDGICHLNLINKSKNDHKEEEHITQNLDMQNNFIGIYENLIFENCI